MSTIDKIIEERHLLKHPFYRSWQEGKVAFDALREYAKQYYSYEARLPQFLQAAIGHVPEGPARRALEENLADESGQPEPHPELWIRFAESLGVTADEVRRAEPTPETAALVDTYAALCDKGSDEALGALYAYESQFSAIAKTKADGLRRFYGITDARSLKFFDLHSLLDDEHASAIRSGLSHGERAQTAARLAAEAWWAMLDQFVEDRSPEPPH